jgi:hypothetical protein
MRSVQITLSAALFCTVAPNIACLPLWTPASETRLIATSESGPPAKEPALGMKRVSFATEGSALEVKGESCFRNEHKSAFGFLVLIAPADRVCDCRHKLRIKCKDQPEPDSNTDCSIELSLDRVWREGQPVWPTQWMVYQGVAPLRLQLSKNRLNIDLKDVQLRQVEPPHDIIRVSGKVVARRQTHESRQAVQQGRP